jgi:hypothetical protein
MAGALGGSFGLLLAFLKAQPLAPVASAYAMNSILYSGSVLGKRNPT